MYARRGNVAKPEEGVAVNVDIDPDEEMTDCVDDIIGSSA